MTDNNSTENIKILKIADIEILTQSNVHIGEPDVVEQKINELIHGGIDKLQVITDFDFTLTKQHLPNGEKVLTSFGIFNACKHLPPHYVEESYKLYKKYRPLEINPHISKEEKTIYMIEWWVKTGELLNGFEFDMSEVDEITVNAAKTLRDGSFELFRDLAECEIPVLVFSAGLGDCVVSVLKSANVFYPNVKVISNFLKFHEDTKILDGLKDKLIHAFNKNEHALEGTDYYDQVHSRDHVIVMGDSLGDSAMADGVPSQSSVLKIGFLYDHPEQNLAAYTTHFDIVLVDDQTMGVPQKLLELIRKQKY
jgi:5'-nucleotidase